MESFNTARRQHEYCTAKDYIEKSLYYDKRKVKLDLPSDFGHKSFDLYHHASDLNKGDYHDSELKQESEVWCEHFSPQRDIAIYTLLEEDFFKFLFSNTWANYAVLRVPEGALMQRLIKCLFDHIYKNQIRTYKSARYDLCQNTPGSKSASNKKVEVCPVKINLTYYYIIDPDSIEEEESEMNLSMEHVPSCSNSEQYKPNIWWTEFAIERKHSYDSFFLPTPPGGITVEKRPMSHHLDVLEPSPSQEHIHVIPPKSISPSLPVAGRMRSSILVGPSHSRNLQKSHVQLITPASQIPMISTESHHSPRYGESGYHISKHWDPKHQLPVLGESRHHSPTFGESRHHSPTLGESRHHSPTLGESRHQSPTLEESRHYSPTFGESRHHSPTIGDSRHHSPTFGESRHHHSQDLGHHSPEPFESSNRFSRSWDSRRRSTRSSAESGHSFRQRGFSQFSHRSGDSNNHLSPSRMSWPCPGMSEVRVGPTSSVISLRSNCSSRILNTEPLEFEVNHAFKNDQVAAIRGFQKKGKGSAMKLVSITQSMDDIEDKKDAKKEKKVMKRIGREPIVSMRDKHVQSHWEEEEINFCNFLGQRYEDIKTTYKVGTAFHPLVKAKLEAQKSEKKSYRCDKPTIQEFLQDKRKMLKKKKDAINNRKPEYIPQNSVQEDATKYNIYNRDLLGGLFPNYTKPKKHRDLASHAESKRRLNEFIISSMYLHSSDRTLEAGSSDEGEDDVILEELTAGEIWVEKKLMEEQIQVLKFFGKKKNKIPPHIMSFMEGARDIVRTGKAPVHPRRQYRPDNITQLLDHSEKDDCAKPVEEYPERITEFDHEGGAIDEEAYKSLRAGLSPTKSLPRSPTEARKSGNEDSDGEKETKKKGYAGRGKDIKSKRRHLMRQMKDFQKKKETTPVEGKGDGTKKKGGSKKRKNSKPRKRERRSPKRHSFTIKDELHYENYLMTTGQRERELFPHECEPDVCPPQCQLKQYQKLVNKRNKEKEVRMKAIASEKIGVAIRKKGKWQFKKTRKKGPPQGILVNIEEKSPTVRRADSEIFFDSQQLERKYSSHMIRKMLLDKGVRTEPEPLEDINTHLEIAKAVYCRSLLPKTAFLGVSKLHKIHTTCKPTKKERSTKGCHNPEHHEHIFYKHMGDFDQMIYKAVETFNVRLEIAVCAVGNKVVHLRSLSFTRKYSCKYGMPNEKEEEEDVPDEATAGKHKNKYT